MENIREEQDIFDVLGKLDKLSEEHSFQLQREALFQYLGYVFDKHKTMPLIAQVSEYQLTQEENLLLLLLMWSKISNKRGRGGSTDIDLDKIFNGDDITRTRLSQQILNGSAAITEKRLLNVEPSRTDFVLSDISLTIMKKSGLVVF